MLHAYAHEELFAIGVEMGLQPSFNTPSRYLVRYDYDSKGMIKI